MFPYTSVAEYTILWIPTGNKELGYGPSTWVRVATLELSVAWGISHEMLTGWPFLSAYLKMSSGQFCISGLSVSKWFYPSSWNIKLDNETKVLNFPNTVCYLVSVCLINCI